MAGEQSSDFEERIRHLERLVQALIQERKKADVQIAYLQQQMQLFRALGPSTS